MLCRGRAMTDGAKDTGSGPGEARAGDGDRRRHSADAGAGGPHRLPHPATTRAGGGEHARAADREEEALRAAYVRGARHVLGPLRDIEPEGDWRTRACAALERLLGAIAEEPDVARLLIVEARSGGAARRRERDLVLEHVEDAIEAALYGAGTTGRQTLDIPARALIGGVRAVIARHLRERSEHVLPGLRGELLAWVDSYAVASEEGRWSAGPRARLPAAKSPRPQSPRYPIPSNPPARSDRARLIFATAETMKARGYADTTTADIAAAAGLSRAAFGEYFRDKAQAFAEAQRFGAQRVVDACAAAYFAQESWPRRVWAGMGTLLGILAEHSALAHLRLVESYAAGLAAAARVEEMTRAFNIFLEEGYHQPSAWAAAAPRLFRQAVPGAVLELLQGEVARDFAECLPERLPQLTYIVLAPFLGAAGARKTVRELAES